MSEQEIVQNHPKAAFTTTILIPVAEGLKAIKVEADDYVVDQIRGGKDPQLTKALVERLAHEVVESHRLMGLTLVGLKKLSLHKDMPSGAEMLFTLNEDLVRKLRPTVSKGLKAIEEVIQVWLCAEDDAC